MIHPRMIAHQPIYCAQMADLNLLVRLRLASFASLSPRSDVHDPYEPYLAMAHADSSPPVIQRGSHLSHTAVDEKQQAVVHHESKDPEKSGQTSAKVFDPTSSFDVYGNEEEAASTSLSYV